MSLFEYDFMVRALIGALLTGLIAPAIGIYLVQRRLSLIGDGLGHVALTGVGVGLLTRSSPVLGAVIAAALGAVAIELVRERGKTSGDVALAILFYGGISGGVVLVSLSNGQSGSKALVSYLFGSPLTTSVGDLVTIGVLAIAVVSVSLLLRPWLFAVCHDEEYARVAGVPIRAINLTLAVTTAVTVTAAMRAVGLLLVSALMVVPVVTAQQLTRGFAATMYLGMFFGVAVAAAGLAVSWQFDTAPGATVVLLAIAVFAVVSATAGVIRTAWRRASAGTAGPPGARTHGASTGEAVAHPEPHEVVLDQ